MICERCWKDACTRAMTLGGYQTDHYKDLLAERDQQYAETGLDPCPQQKESEGEAATRADA